MTVTTFERMAQRVRVPPRRLALAGLLVIGGLVVVYGGSREYFTQQLVAIACVYAILALSLDLVWGYVGILSMGQAVFFGLGAYVVGLSQVRVTDTGGARFVTQHFWNFPLGIVSGIAVAVVVAVLVGAIGFYGKGSTPFYIAVVTLSLTVILSTVLVQTAFVGGQQGLSGFPILTISGTTWYYICALGLALAWAGCGVIVRSDFGVLMRAIRDNEQRCRYLGFDVARVKTMIFAGSAGLAALAGAIYAGYVGFVSPPFVGFMVATNIIIWVAVGGRGTLIGAVAGGLAINLGGEHLSARFPYVWTLMLGLLFVLVVVVFPEGVLPGAGRLISKVARRPHGAGHLLTQNREVTVRSVAGGLPAVEPTTARPRTDTALAIQDLHLAYGALRVLRGVTLDVRDGELLCIVGPNGAGKTTLLSVISDGSVPHEGSVSACDKRDGREVSLRGMRPGRIVRTGIGRKFQNPNLFETLTPLETVLLASRQGAVPSLWRRTKRVEVTPQAAEILRSTGLEQAINVPAQDLSHGLKQALEVAMTVSLEPTILLLDEPTAGLTLDERALIGDLLRELVAQGITIILIEHDFAFVRRIADRIAVLHDGKLLEIGSVDQIASSELVKRVYLGSGR